MSNETAAATSTGNTHAAAKGILLTIILRLLSFILTQLQIRCSDPDTLGRASIRLELICNTTVLFLGREGFRLALLRVAEVGSSIIGDNGAQVHNVVLLPEFQAKRIRVTNVAWLSIPVGLSLTAIATTVHLVTYRSQSDEAGALDYKVAGLLYCFATALEVLSEPFMILCLRTMDVTTRAKAEGAASIAKAFSCVFLLNCLQSSQEEGRNKPFTSIPMNLIGSWIPGPVSVFGISQCIYAFTVTMILIRSKRYQVALPCRLITDKRSSATTNPIMTLLQNFDIKTLRLALIFSLQSIFKHFLTEGDRIVLTALAGTYDSGIYAMVSSYGGMASRIIFQPLEENGRLLFSTQHAAIHDLLEKEHVQTLREQAEEYEKTYFTLVKLVGYIGLIFSSLGANYTSVLIRVLAGSKWGSNPEASEALSAFCQYIALMSLNGMTEAFVYGAANSKEVGQLTVAHGIVGFIFYLSAPILISNGAGGTVGLIKANGLCMGLRSLYSLHFAFNYFRKLRLMSKQTSENFLNRFLRVSISPRPPVLVCMLLAHYITKYSRKKWIGYIEDDLHVDVVVDLLSMGTALHVLTGFFCFITIALVTSKTEGEFGRSLKSMVTRRKGVKRKED